MVRGSPRSTLGNPSLRVTISRLMCAGDQARITARMLRRREAMEVGEDRYGRGGHDRPYARYGLQSLQRLGKGCSLDLEDSLQGLHLLACRSPHRPMLADIHRQDLVLLLQRALEFRPPCLGAEAAC